MHLGGYLVLIVEVFFTILCSELEQVFVSAEAVSIFNSKAFNGTDGTDTEEGMGDMGTDTYNASAARSVRVVRDASSIKFLLKYTGIENGRQIYKGYKEHLLESGFIRGAPTKIICHGYIASHREPGGPGEVLTPAYLKAWEGRELNIINVDWSQIAWFWGSHGKGGWYGFYCPPARNTELVGDIVGAMIEFLVKELGMDLDKFHLIGHSLGAHAMGYAGKYLRTKFGRRVGRITALDPAGPCFETYKSVCHFFNSGPYRHVNIQDATFVDAIHTHGRFYGMKQPVGDADFYPNGGNSQPGCSWYSLGVCSHKRSIELMRESILNKGRGIIAHRCLDETAWWKEACSSPARDTALLGEPCSPSAKGQYFLKTESNPPYRSLA